MALPEDGASLTKPHALLLRASQGISNKGVQTPPSCSPSQGGWRECSHPRKLRSPVGRGPWNGQISWDSPLRPGPRYDPTASTLCPMSEGGFPARTHLAPLGLFLRRTPWHWVVMETEPDSKCICQHVCSGEQGGRPESPSWWPAGWYAASIPRSTGGGFVFNETHLWETMPSEFGVY